MDQSTFWPVAGRSILGALACGFLGLVATCLASDFIRYHPPDDGYGPLWTAVAVCAVAGAAISGLAGHWEIRGVAKCLLGGALVGVVLGLLGGFAFGAVASYDGKKFMPPKEGPARVRQGIYYGVPVGTIGGSLVGLSLGMIRLARRGSCEEGDRCEDCRHPNDSSFRPALLGWSTNFFCSLRLALP